MTQKQAIENQDVFTNLISYINNKSKQDCVYFNDLQRLNPDKYAEMVYFCRLLERSSFIFRIKVGIYSIEKNIPLDLNLKSLIDKYFHYE